MNIEYRLKFNKLPIIFDIVKIPYIYPIIKIRGYYHNESSLISHRTGLSFTLKKSIALMIEKKKEAFHKEKKFMQKI